MPSSPAPRPLSITRADRIALLAIAIAAFAIAAVWVVVGGARLLGPLALGTPITAELLPADPSTATATVDGVVASRITAEAVSIAPDAISRGATVQLIAAETLSAIVIAIVCAFVGYAILQLTRGAAFHRPLYVLGMATGATLALGGMVAAGLRGGAQMVAANELNTRIGSDYFVVGFTFDPAPIGVGFAIMTLAVVYQVGARLQRDTAGLV